MTENSSFQHTIRNWVRQFDIDENGQSPRRTRRNATSRFEAPGNILAITQFERDVISQRIRAALAANKAQGKRLGRPVTMNPDTRQLILEFHNAGDGYTAIAQELQARRIPTAQGREWWRPTIRTALHSHRLDQEAETITASP